MAYPPRGYKPWDDLLKAYIDGNMGATNAQVAEFISQSGLARDAVIGVANAQGYLLPSSLPTQAVAEAGVDATARGWSVLRVWQAARAMLTGTEPSQAQAEAGTDTTVRGWSALRVRQAIIGARFGETGAWRQVATQMTWSNPTSFTILTDTAERTALTTTMSKRRADTVLEVVVNGTLQLNSGVGQLIYLGLRINGTDYQIAQCHTTVAAPVRVVLVGQRRLTGLAAGTLTIEPVVASGTASQVIAYTGADFISYTIRETYASS